MIVNGWGRFVQVLGHQLVIHDCSGGAGGGMIVGGWGYDFQGTGRLVQVLGHQLTSHDCSGGRWRGI